MFHVIFCMDQLHCPGVPGAMEEEEVAEEMQEDEAGWRVLDFLIFFLREERSGSATGRLIA